MHCRSIRLETIALMYGEIAMSDTVQSENSGHAAEAKEGHTSIVQYLVIGAAILGFAALIAYQLFGCSACYG